MRTSLARERTITRLESTRGRIERIKRENTIARGVISILHSVAMGWSLAFFGVGTWA